MPNARIHPRRQGFGLLTVILLVLVLLVPLVFGLMYRGRSLTRLLAHEEQDQEAAWLADAVLEEAVHRIRVRAATPGDAFYSFMREAAAGSVLGLELADLPAAAAELALSRGYRLAGPVRVELVRQGYLTGRAELAADYEFHGVLRLAARIDGRGTGRCERTREYPYRVVLVAAPRPFDRPTFLLADARPLLRQGAPWGDANASIAHCIDAIPAWKARLAEDRARFEAARRQDGLPASVAPALDGMIAAYRGAEAELAALGPDWKLVDLGAAGDEAPRSLHRFPAELSVYTDAAEIDLGVVDLPSRTREPAARIEEHRQRIEEANQRRETALAALSGMLGGGAAGADELAPVARDLADASRVFVDAVIHHVEAMDRLLAVYYAFQVALEELDGSGAAFVESQLARLGATELRRKANFLFRGAEAREALEAFLQDHPGGVVHVEAGTEPLRLAIDGFRGRMLLSVDGELVVERATVADPARDALVLVASKGATLQGPVQAALLAVAAPVETRGAERIGSLVLGRLVGDPAQVLVGVLRRQEAQQTSPASPGSDRLPPRPDTLRVEIDPFPAHGTVRR